MTVKTPYLSIIVPSYNEESRLPATLKRIVEYLSTKDFSYEIIVVDDGSRDKTSEVARLAAPGAPVTAVKNEVNSGKGFSVKRGALAACGDVVLFSDADLSTPIEELDKMLPLIKAGADMVIGSRALPESDLAVPQPWHRQLMGRVFNVLVRMLVVGGFKDTQCGFKCMTKDAAEKIFGRMKTTGFAFDVEMIFIARKLGMTVKEVPVRWINSPDSRVRLVGGSLSMLVELFKIRLRHAGTGKRS